MEKRDIYFVAGCVIFALTITYLAVMFAFNKYTEGDIIPIDTTKAVIHHTASPDVSANIIDIWHKERGLKEIGYHFVIRKDGTIEKGRSLTKIGAHAKDRNHYVGIALTGYDKFTKEQISSLIKLLKKLGTTHIEHHHNKCPGDGLDLDMIRKEIQTKGGLI